MQEIPERIDGEAMKISAGNYRALFSAQMDVALVNHITAATWANVVPGDSRFANEIVEALGRRVLKGAVGRPTKRSVS